MSEVVFMEDLQTKGDSSDVKIKPSHLPVHKKHKSWAAEKKEAVKISVSHRGSLFVERARGRLQATLKNGGGSLQVWGRFSAYGVWSELVVASILRGASRLLSIMQYHQGGVWSIPHFILQHNSRPKHTARVIKNYPQWKEEQSVLQQIVWAPESPDPNIIESVWNYMKRQKQLRQKNCGKFSKTLGTTYLPSTLKCTLKN